MDSNFLPLWKVLDAPLVSLDASHVELFSILALFMLTFVTFVSHAAHRQWLRHLVQLLSVMVFFYIVYSCLGVFGMIRNVLHGATLIGTVFTESFFWMSLPLVVIAFSITSGPYFCGWICPTGTFQEIASIIRERVGSWLGQAAAKRVPPLSIKTRAWVVVLLLVCFIAFLGWVFWLGTLTQFYVEDSSLYWGAGLLVVVFLVLTRQAADQAVRALRALSFYIILTSALLKTAIVSPVHFAFADVTDPASALTTLVLVVASLFISRAWCRYVCPWGYLMACVHRVSRLQVSSAVNCDRCGTCDAVCRVGAIRHGQVAQDQCQFCMACIDRCPTQSLRIIDRWKRDDQK